MVEDSTSISGHSVANELNQDEYRLKEIQKVLDSILISAWRSLQSQVLGSLQYPAAQNFENVHFSTGRALWRLFLICSKHAARAQHTRELLGRWDRLFGIRCWLHACDSCGTAASCDANARFPRDFFWNEALNAVLHLSELSDQLDVTLESSKRVKLDLTWVATTQSDIQTCSKRYSDLFSPYSGKHKIVAIKKLDLSWLTSYILHLVMFSFFLSIIVSGKLGPIF
jgi:hypothetical protein